MKALRAEKDVYKRQTVICIDSDLNRTRKVYQALEEILSLIHIFINTAISKIPDDADLVITHVELTGTAKAAQPNKQHLSISNYLKAPEYDQLVERFKNEL